MITKLFPVCSFYEDASTGVAQHLSVYLLYYFSYIYNLFSVGSTTCGSLRKPDIELARAISEYNGFHVGAGVHDTDTCTVFVLNPNTVNFNFN